MAKRGPTAEPLEDRNSVMSEFGATSCICRVATRHISLPHNVPKDTMVITGEDQHNSIDKVPRGDRQSETGIEWNGPLVDRMLPW
jgi:hypothetical protein